MEKVKIVKPLRAHDFEVGDKKFWFQEMICEKTYAYGGSHLTNLAICPITDCLMVLNHGRSWDIFPKNSCTMDAYEAYHIEKILLVKDGKS